MSQYEPPRQKHKIVDFDFCYGLGVNWIDLSDNTQYFIQEYRDKKDAGANDTRIRYLNEVTGKTGYISEYQLRQKMKDPPVDPRYEAETPEEHRKDW